MPYVFLDDATVKAGTSISDDPEADNLLQEMRRRTGDRWIVRVRPVFVRQGIFRKPREVKHYAIYEEAGGEWGLPLLAQPQSAPFSISGLAEGSRERVMNFMLGFLAAFDTARAKGWR